MKTPLRPAPITPPRVGTACFATLLAGLMALGLPASGADAKAPAKDPATAPPTTEAADAAKTDEKAEKADDKEAAKEGEKEAEADKSEKSEETPAAEEAAPGDFRNWFNVSVGGLIIDGDKGAAQRRLGLPGSAFGGVEEFHFEKDVSKTAVFKVDGRGIFNNEDYRLKLEYNDSDRGFIRGGVEQSRSFYDSTGGWVPGDNRWADLFGDPFETVRGTAFFEAGLRKPDKPEFTIRYEHRYRDGMKDSTIWGRTDPLVGLGPRMHLPGALRVDERSDIVGFDARHTLGKVTFGGAFSYQRDELDNARLLWMNPGQPWVRDPGATHVTHTEKVERDIYSARAFADTVFNDKVRLSAAYMFTTLDTLVGGSRLFGADFDPVYNPATAYRSDLGFVNLVGLSQVDQHVWTLNLRWVPLPNVTVIPAFRMENQVMDGSSAWLDTMRGDAPRNGLAARDVLDLSQQLEVRYTGITNVVLYARGDWVEGDGNVLERGSSAWFTSPYARDTDFDRISQKYSAGAHWYPLAKLNLHAQYYRKMRDNRYDVTPTALAGGFDLYPGYINNHDFTTDDVNFRVTWRPLDKLTLTTRYDYQISTIEMQGAGRTASETSERQAHIIGQTLTWTPVTRLYVQPGVNFVLDATESPATTSGFPVAPADNDYVTVNCTVGVVLDDRTDFQTQYSYYLANNFDPAFAAVSMPYGAGAEEHGVLASLIRRITPRLRMTLRYGYFTSRADMSGGFDDYDAHLLYTSAQYLF